MSAGMDAALRPAIPVQRLASRAAAFGLLALLLALLLPWLGAPVSRYFELRSLAESERELLAGLQARNAVMVAFAGPDRLVAAPDATSAFGLLQARLSVAVPPEAMRVDAMELLAPEPKLPGVVRVSIIAQATASGLQRFAEILETGAPVMRIVGLELAPAPPEPGRAALPQPLNARIEVVAGFVAPAGPPQPGAAP